MSNEIDAQNQRTHRHNNAVIANRLIIGNVTEKHIERCHQCGDLLHPYPNPEYWMQYPLPECCIIDGLKFCNNHRKPGCIDAYLIEHPTLAGKKKQKKAEKHKEKPTEREEITAALAALMPTDKNGLVAEAMTAVTALHSAVLSFDSQGAADAGNRYEAAVWKLNGGTFFGCRADDLAAGKIIEKHCAAALGEIPMWGQNGQFLIEVEGIRALVDFGYGYGIGGTHYDFHAVDLDSHFISETGYRSHLDVLAAGRTVDEAASAIFAGYLKERRGKINQDDRNRLATKPLPTWCTRLVPQARRESTVIVPPGFVQVDVVLPPQKAFIVRKWAAEAQAKIETASMSVKSNVINKSEGFCVGQRCKIVNVHHPVFAKEIGKQIIITKVSQDTRQVWAHDDKPPTYRINRNGRRVIEHNPKCVQTIYGFDNLRIMNK
ncbi:MAG: klcB [Methylobacter sp.]|nr:klcB [Methylobacter sp.]